MANDSAKIAHPSTRTARTLRRHQSDAERRLWWYLRARQLSGVKFRRQQPIGPYVVDFCALDPKLVIEVDGGQHMERAVDDAHRSAYLQRCGYAVLRFWNDDVLQRIEAVLEQIEQAIKRTRQEQGEKRSSDSLTQPLPEGEGPSVKHLPAHPTSKPQAPRPLAGADR